MSNDKSTKLLIDFFSAMYEWEDYCSKNTAVEPDLKREKLRCIFERYCTAKERKNDRLSSLSYSIPHEYDLDFQRIESTSTEGNKTIIETQKLNGLKQKFRYFLIEKNNEIKIDKKEWFDFSKTKWVKCII